MSAVLAEDFQSSGKKSEQRYPNTPALSGMRLPILSRVASFAPTFFKLINIGAGAAIIVAGMGLIYSQFGTQD